MTGDNIPWVLCEATASSPTNDDEGGNYGDTFHNADP